MAKQAKQATYLNPWWTAHSEDPREYQVRGNPTLYRGFELHNRIPGRVCDVVRSGVCIRQMVTVRGAKRAVDAILDGSDDFLGVISDKAMAALALAGARTA